MPGRGVHLNAMALEHTVDGAQGSAPDTSGPNDPLYLQLAPFRV